MAGQKINVPAWPVIVGLIVTMLLAYFTRVGAGDGFLIASVSWMIAIALGARRG